MYHVLIPESGAKRQVVQTMMRSNEQVAWFYRSVGVGFRRMSSRRTETGQFLHTLQRGNEILLVSCNKNAVEDELNRLTAD